MTPLRSQFSEAAQDAGGKLYCLKKASGFKIWAQRAECPFFVLLVDWREAKQCAEFLFRELQVPHSLVVYTLSDKQCTQALCWSSALQMQGYIWPMHVLPPSYEGNNLAVYAAGLLRHCAGLESPACRS